MKKFILISVILHGLFLFFYHVKHTNNLSVTKSDNVNLVKTINLKSFNNINSNSLQTSSKNVVHAQTAKLINHEQSKDINQPPAEINLREGITDSTELIHFVEPIYPTIARQRNLEGKVILELEISPNGSVNQVQILKSSGFEILDKSALESAKTWKFKTRSDHSLLKFTKEVVFQLNN